VFPMPWFRAGFGREYCMQPSRQSEQHLSRLHAEKIPGREELDVER
jgi:hypothetical protein